MRQDFCYYVFVFDPLSLRLGAAGTDYFAMLVRVFAREVSDSAHAHLAAFHALVPALSLAAVEAGLLAKEGLARKRRGVASPDAAFTDDGFALGLAYLLKVAHLDSVLLTNSTCTSLHLKYRQLIAGRV